MSAKTAIPSDGAAAATRRCIGLCIGTELRWGRGILEGFIRFTHERPRWQAHHLGTARWPAIERMLGERPFDGLVVEGEDLQAVEALAGLGLPTVVVSSRLTVPERPHIGQVVSDNEAVGRMAFEHLRSLGFAHYAFCGHADKPFSERRWEGYRAAAAETGISSVYTGPGQCPGATAHRDATINWLLTLPKPIALFAATDSIALAVTRAITEAGRVIPRDFAVLGVDDDHLVCMFAHPPLSSIDNNTFTIGYRAGLLLERLMSGKAGGNRTEIVPPAGVVSRRSTDTLAAEAPHVREAMRLIQEEACNGLTIERLLKRLRISRRKLEVDYKQQTGRTLQQELVRQQVARARHLLTETDLPTVEIAVHCGFEYASRLSTVFKRETGLTPTAYRRQYRQTGPRD